MKKISKFIICLIIALVSLVFQIAVYASDSYTDAILDETIVKAESLTQDFSGLISYEDDISSTEEKYDPVRNENVKNVYFRLSTGYVLGVTYNSNNEIITSAVLPSVEPLALLLMIISVIVFIYFVSEGAYEICEYVCECKARKKLEKDRVSTVSKTCKLFRRRKKGENKNEEKDNENILSNEPDTELADTTSDGSGQCR